MDRNYSIYSNMPENTLIAEVLQDAVHELGISEGTAVFAAIKASAFRMLPG